MKGGGGKELVFIVGYYLVILGLMKIIEDN